MSDLHHSQPDGASASAPPHGLLVRVSRSTRRRLSEQARAGRALRLGPGIYAVGASLPPEQVARHHMHAIIAEYWPGGVLCGITALAGGIPVNGVVFISRTPPQRPTELKLPGITVVPVVVPGALPGDTDMPA